jgi:hypothetical protein
MNDQQPLPIAEQQEPSVFTDSYYLEVQQHNWDFERNKTMTTIFTMSGILLFGDLLGLLMADALTGVNFLFALVVPAIIAAFAFVGLYKPLLGMILATGFYAVVMIIIIILSGGVGIFSGGLLKAVIIYFIIRGFHHARDAEEARKNLSVIQ